MDTDMHIHLHTSTGTYTHSSHSCVGTQTKEMYSKPGDEAGDLPDGSVALAVKISLPGERRVKGN